MVQGMHPALDYALYKKYKSSMPKSFWVKNTYYCGKSFLDQDMAGEVGAIQNDLPSAEKPAFESQPLCYEFLWGMKGKRVSKPILPTERKQNL